MPIYEYECSACQKRFERIQRLSDPLLTVCPNCGGGVHKAFSVPAIQFKGSGWYITDHPKKGSAPAETKSEAKAAPAEAKSEAKTAPAEAAKPKPDKASS